MTMSPHPGLVRVATPISPVGAGGREIERAAAGTFTSLGLELGGKDPGYVRADADLDFAVENLAMAPSSIPGKAAAASSASMCMSSFSASSSRVHRLTSICARDPLASETASARWRIRLRRSRPRTQSRSGCQGARPHIDVNAFPPMRPHALSRAASVSGVDIPSGDD